MNKYYKSDIGKQRDVNQDGVLYLTKDNYIFALLCDGMGGINGGGLASKTCLEVAKKEFEKEFDFQDIEDIKKWLYKLILKANKKIKKLASFDDSLYGMGTTFLAVLISGENKVFASVGDSRLYLLNQKELKQLSEDQTFVAALLRAGYISERQAKVHPRRSMLLSVVGGGSDEEMDIQINTIEEKGTLLLCSDGLYNMVKDSQIMAILKEEIPLTARGDKLMNAANEAGGFDNVSVILLENKI